MKHCIALLVLVALAGQALSFRVRREVEDDSDAVTTGPADPKVQALNVALFFVLNEGLMKEMTGQDNTKLVNRAAELLLRIKYFGGDVDELNQGMLAVVSDSFTEVQRQKLVDAGVDLS